MKRVLPGAVVTAVLLGGACLGAAAPADAQAQLKKLVNKVQAELSAGKHTETELAPFLKEFDSLLAEHKGEKTDDVARILFLKAMLHVQVLEQYDKGLESLKRLKSEFPDTQYAKRVAESIAELESIVAKMAKQKEFDLIQSRLAVGTQFPDFNETDLGGKPLSIANFKGKVVLLDFWATWCPACLHELPELLKTYQQHHRQGFEVIGISLDQERGALTDFVKERKVPWPQFLDGAQNKLATKYGVYGIPTTFLLDGQGKIIGKNLYGDDLADAVAKALAK